MLGEFPSALFPLVLDLSHLLIYLCEFMVFPTFPIMLFDNEEERVCLKSVKIGLFVIRAKESSEEATSENAARLLAAAVDSTEAFNVGAAIFTFPSMLLFKHITQDYKELML